MKYFIDWTNHVTYPVQHFALNCKFVCAVLDENFLERKFDVRVLNIAHAVDESIPALKVNHQHDYTLRELFFDLHIVGTNLIFLVSGEGRDGRLKGIVYFLKHFYFLKVKYYKLKKLIQKL